jgi:hypothetical protein
MIGSAKRNARLNKRYERFKRYCAQHPKKAEKKRDKEFSKGYWRFVIEVIDKADSKLLQKGCGNNNYSGIVTSDDWRFIVETKKQK